MAHEAHLGIMTFAALLPPKSLSSHRAQTQAAATGNLKIRTSATLRAGATTNFTTNDSVCFGPLDKFGFLHD